MYKSKQNHKYRSKKKDTECTLTVEEWDKIIENQQNRCAFCGKAFTTGDPPIKDHIIPVIEDGGFTRENTQAVHKKCNSHKGGKIDKSNIVSWVARPDLCVDG